MPTSETSTKLALPGSINPDYTFSYFSDIQNEIYQRRSLRDFTRVARQFPENTLKYIHFLVSNERQEEAGRFVKALGGQRKVTQICQKTWSFDLQEMSEDLVSLTEKLRFIGELKKLGLGELISDRQEMWVDEQRLKEIQGLKPTFEEVTDFVDRFNKGEIKPLAYMEDTEGVRVLDIKRGLRYIGIARTMNYDWLAEIETVDGIKLQLLHYFAPDPKTNIVLVRRFKDGKTDFEI